MQKFDFPRGCRFTYNGRPFIVNDFGRLPACPSIKNRWVFDLSRAHKSTKDDDGYFFLSELQEELAKGNITILSKIVL